MCDQQTPRNAGSEYGRLKSETLVPPMVHLSSIPVRKHPVEDPDHKYYNPMIRGCIAKAPRLLGCEAAYFFPKDVDVCLSNPAEGGPNLGRLTQEQRVEGGGAGNLLLHVRSGDVFEHPSRFYGQVSCSAPVFNRVCSHLVTCTVQLPACTRFSCFDTLWSALCK